MRELDPRIMLLTAACFSTMGVIIQNTPLLACVFAAAVMFGLALKADMAALAKRLKGLLGVIVFVALMQSIFVKRGADVLSIGGFSVLTTGGLLAAANTILRLGTVIASASVFTLTTSRMMAQGLIQLGVPYEIAFMTFVALKFLPVFSEEFRDTVIAIQLRGVDLKRIPIRDKIKMYAKIMMPVTYSAADRAQKLSYAMELRAFRAMPKRTSRITLRFRASDHIYLVMFPVLTAGALAYYYLCL
jgi:energy-coupling factor transport system permease protein